MSLKVSRVLHAGYLFESNHTRLLFDPIFESPFSKNCYAFPAVEFDIQAIKNLKLDAIFISHYHDDHFSMESLNLLDRNTPVYMFSIFDELFQLLKTLGFQKIHPIELSKSIQLGEFEILPLEALDQDVDSIYHIKTQGLNILNVVDSWIGPSTMEKLLETQKWDLILWPMQCMRELEVLSPSTAEPITAETLELPNEWIEQLQQLNPTALIPSACQFRFEDWSWYNQSFFPISYAQFEKQIHVVLPKTQVLRLNPGQSLTYENAFRYGDRIPWIKPIGPQEIDYTFELKSTPLATEEIAKKLCPLSKAQQQLVERFCQQEILSRFSQLMDWEDSFFRTQRIWQLRTYTHDGHLKAYNYEIAGQNIKRVENSDLHDWSTEIPESKLFGALDDGESLTSIYVRVNNPNGQDPLEDPLLRCLYEGLLGSYQKAQLKRLHLTSLNL